MTDLCDRKALESLTFAWPACKRCFHHRTEHAVDLERPVCEHTGPDTLGGCGCDGYVGHTPKELLCASIANAMREVRKDRDREWRIALGHSELFGPKDPEECKVYVAEAARIDREHTETAIRRAVIANGREANRIGFRDAMDFMKRRADEWRNGARSIKGHHLPLKHVYRWLAELQEVLDRG